MRKIFVLVASLFLCTLFATAQNNVIDKDLQTILNQKSDDYIDINIIFKSQMTSDDFAVLNCKSDSKEVRREIVINELKKFAEKSQRDVMSVINAEERSNSVIDIKSYWIANFINCKAKADVIYKLASHPDVAAIIHNAKEDTYCGVESDTETRNIQATTGNIAEHVTQVKADKVWDLGYTGKGVVVAVLDSGVNTNHIDIKNNLWNGNAQYGYNVVNPGQLPSDHSDHGTHCAGVIAGDGTGGTMTGIAPDAQVMCIKIHDATGLSLSQFITGIEWAAENEADILSISQGFKKTSTAITDAGRATMRSTFENLLELGIIAAVASGNDGNDLATLAVPHNVRTPGNCPPPWIHPDQEGNNGGKTSVISVGAVDKSNSIVGSSAHGPVTWQHISGYNDYPYNPGIGLIRPDICAPGHLIESLANATSGYRKTSGTSQATPCVAGVMALMLEKNPDLTPEDLCRIIETTASNKPATKDNRMGSGIIDALAAVQAVSFNDPVVINPYAFTSTLNTGSNLNLQLTLINNGSSSTSGTTSVTISENDNYTTIVQGSKTYSAMAAGATASATFVVNIDPLVEDNHVVTFTVTATNGSYSRTFEMNVNISNEFVAPSISAEANGTSVNLTWNATNNATSYNVYRDDALLGNTTSTSYTDSGLEYGTIYAYTVTSKRGELESEHSMKIRVQTADDPQGPTPTNIAADNGTVTWTNGAANSIGANIYRKDCQSGVETKIASDIKATSYTDNSWNTLANGIYQYGVANLYTSNAIAYEDGFDNINYEMDTYQDGKWYYYKDNSNNKYSWSISDNITTGQNTNPVTINSRIGKSAFILSPSSKGEVTYLVSPQMDFTQYNANIKLSFYYITPSWGDDINTLDVKVSNTYNGDWTNVWSSNKTDASEWTNIEIDLSQYAGQKVYIAFANTAGYGYCTGVDDVKIAVEGGNTESRIGWSENLYKGVNVFVQDGNWSNTDNWSMKRLPNENDSQVFINANATIASGDVTVNTLTINEGASLTLNDGVILTVNGDFANTDVDAFIINDGAQVFQNNDDLAATFNMNITNPGDWTNDHNTGWQFIASPVKGAKIDDFVPTYSDYDLYKFDGSKRLSWLNHKDENIYDEEPEVPGEPEEPGEFQDTVIVGNGENKSMALPIYTSNAYSISQQIYTAEDIGQTGNIIGVSFKLNQSYICTRSIEIYIQHTAKESFNDEYSWESMASESKVYDGDIEISETANEWIDVIFSKPFAYTGGNMVICVYDKTNNSYNATYFCADELSENKSIYYAPYFSNPINPSNVAKSGKLTNLRNQIKLSFSGNGGGNHDTPEVPSAPQNVVATAIGTSSIALTWDAVANATTYNVYQRDNQIATGLTTTSYNVEGLTANTEYCFTVTAVNEDSESDASNEDCAMTEYEQQLLCNVIFTLKDSHNDGWDGSYLLVSYDGVSEQLDCPSGASPKTDTLEIPQGSHVTVKYIKSSNYYTYPKENSFTITYESGKKIFSVDKDVLTATTSYEPFTVDCTPTEPENLAVAASVNSESAITLTMSALGADSYTIYQGETLVAEGITTTTYTVEGLTADTEYCFTVVAINEVGSSESVEVCARTKAIGLQSVTVQIGEGTNYTYSSPIYNYYSSKSISQTIYTAEEIGTSAGTITYISFNKYNGNNNTRNIAVYLKNTDKDCFTTTTDWEVLSENLCVYNGSFEFGTNGWDTINLQNSFSYEGGNLLVCIIDKTGSSLSSGGDYFYVYDTGQGTTDARAIFAYGYNIEQDLQKITANTGVFLKSGSTYRAPQIKLGLEIGSAKSVSPAKLVDLNGGFEKANGFTSSGTELSKFETEFQQGTGYLVSYENETIATFKGILHHEKSYQFDVTYNSSNDNANFHLLGNPFAFNMNWNKINITNMVNGYAVINDNGGYEYHADGEINVGDGFLVKTTGDNPSIEYNHNTRRNNDENNFINVIASGKNGNDNVIIRLSGEEEGFPKIQNFNKDLAVIYVSDDNNNYGICNYDSDIEEVELSFRATQMGDYNIHIDANGNFDKIILKDIITGVETDMLTASYSFKSSSQDNSNRFLLKFSMNEDDDAQYIFAYKSGDELIIKDQGSVQIIDMMGRIVYSNDVIKDNNRIDISELNKTAYIIRLANEEGVWTQKVVVY